MGKGSQALKSSSHGATTARNNMKKNKARRMVMPDRGADEDTSHAPAFPLGGENGHHSQSRRRGSMANWIRSTMKYRIT